MHWFKIHHGFCADAKLGMVANKLQIPRAHINAIFLDLLEYASNNSERGSIEGYNIEVASFSLGLPESEVSNALLSLRNGALLLHNKIANWDKYQSPIDYTNSERQRRHREKQKQQVSDTVTASNALRNTDKNRIEKIRKKEIGKPDSVGESVWNDFLVLRKNKKAPVTATVIGMVEKEAVKAGITLEAALAECCTRGWQSFKADWHNKPSQFAKPVAAKSNVRTL